MITILDSMRNGKSYNGNTYKFGVVINNTDFIVKYPKGNDLSVYCEYIASNFIRSLSISCHEVYLGVHNGIVVDVIKDFTDNIHTLHSFKDTKQTSEDTDIDTKEYTYDDVLYLIESHLKIKDKDKELTKRHFWNMFICDAIIGNRDRHWGNWGYIRYNNQYTFAPLYDNGAGLFPDVMKVFKEYTNPVTRKDFLYERIYTFPASLFKIKRPDRSYRSNYYQMFGDLRVNKIFAEQVNQIKKNISYEYVINSVYKIVLPLQIDNTLKRFYMEIITLRYMCIILRYDFKKAYKIVEGLLNG